MQPWESKVVLRSSGPDPWLNPIKSSTETSRFRFVGLDVSSSHGAQDKCGKKRPLTVDIHIWSSLSICSLSSCPRVCVLCVGQGQFQLQQFQLSPEKLLSLHTNTSAVTGVYQVFPKYFLKEVRKSWVSSRTKKRERYLGTPSGFLPKTNVI